MRDAGIEEGELAQPVLQRREIELDHGEGLGRRQEGDLGAALAVRPSPTTFSGATASPSRNSMKCSLPSRQIVQLEPGRQRVDDRDADAVQAAGNLVGILVEFSAGMQLGHDDLGRRHAFALVDVGRECRGRRRARCTEPSGLSVTVDRLGMAGERLVDGVVDDLVDHVMQAGAVIGVADIHARPLAHGVEALEDLDRFRAVIGWMRAGVLAGRLGHRSAFESFAKIGVNRVWL